MSELLQKYPKTAKLVKEYYTNKLLQGLKADLPEEIKNKAKDQWINDETIGEMMEDNPHFLFEFFDENVIFIQILNTSLIPSQFYYKIEGLSDEKFYSKRIEAEKVALSKAFELSESKL